MSVPNRGFLAAINHLLAPAGWARDRLAPHAGRSALLRAEPFEVLFSVLADGFLAPDDAVAAPDVTLTVPLSAAARLVGDPSKAMSAVRIEGNADFADALGFVFRNLRWDAEEDLSRLIGDILARRVVLAAHAVTAGSTRAWQAVADNFAEYFTEEQKLIVTRTTLAAHRDDLARLRDDLARLEKRTDKLSHRADPSRRPDALTSSRPPAGSGSATA